MADEMKITLRLPAELLDALTQMALTEQRSMNGQIIWLLNRAVSQNQEGEPT